MRIKFNWLIIVYLIILPVQISDANLNIIVEPHAKWGNAPTSNIKALCENVALHFNEQLRDEHKINGKLTIVYNPGNPIVWYPWVSGLGKNEYKIGLTVTGTFWAQFSYQFAHEFGHIMHNFEKTLDKENSWFRESICELANLWVIKKMGKTWATRAPYPNWVGWRHNLTNYANTLMSRAEVQYAGTGAEWLSQWESKMRTDTTIFDYARVSQLSYKFLPIFEDNPEAWNAIRQMPISTARMSDYMKIWYSEVSVLDKQFVKQMADVMGISVIATTLPNETDFDADINNDGLVDLSDVRLVRMAMQTSILYDTDVNNDGITNELDILLVKAKAHEAIAAAAPAIAIRKKKLTTWGALKRRTIK